MNVEPGYYVTNEGMEAVICCIIGEYAVGCLSGMERAMPMVWHIDGRFAPRPPEGVDLDLHRRMGGAAETPKETALRECLQNAAGMLMGQVREGRLCPRRTTATVEDTATGDRAVFTLADVLRTALRLTGLSAGQIQKDRKAE